jgi:hypothetical protein
MLMSTIMPLVPKSTSTDPAADRITAAMSTMATITLTTLATSTSTESKRPRIAAAVVSFWRPGAVA